jgi:hypothetical protein
MVSLHSPFYFPVDALLASQTRRSSPNTKFHTDRHALFRPPKCRGPASIIPHVEGAWVESCGEPGGLSFNTPSTRAVGHHHPTSERRWIATGGFLNVPGCHPDSWASHRETWGQRGVVCHPIPLLDSETEMA